MQQGIPSTYYAVIILIVVARFALRELRERKLPLGRIYLMPAFVGCFAALLLGMTASVYPGTYALLAGETLITLGFGLGVGFAVAQFTSVRRGDVQGTVYVLGSYRTVAIWLGALGLRLVARLVIGTSDPAATASANAALLVMVAAALFMQRYQILTRAKALAGSSA